MGNARSVSIYYQRTVKFHKKIRLMNLFKTINLCTAFILALFFFSTQTTFALDGSPGPEPAQSPFITYPFLNAYADSSNCSGIVVEEFLLNDELLVTMTLGSSSPGFPLSSAVIFNGNGDIYCGGFIAFADNCEELAELTNPITSWSCGPDLINVFLCPGESVDLYALYPESDIVGTINIPQEDFICDFVGLVGMSFNDTTTYDSPTGAYFTVSPTENTTYRITSTTVPNGPPIDPSNPFLTCWNISYALTYNVILDENACGGTPPTPESDLFEEYTWLNNISFSCEGGNIVEYSSGIYSFISVESSNGFQLYFQDGTPYCTDGPGFNCVSLYGLSNPVSGVNIENTCEGGGPEEGDNALFEEYTWLSTVISSSDCSNGDSVEEYVSGNYSFLSVTNNGQTNLYFQDGTFYCADAPNFNCVTAYGFSAPNDTWTCGNTTPPTPGETPDVFDNFTWLSAVVNPIDCQVGESVTVYTSGVYSYLMVQTEDGGGQLFFENGTLYCTNSTNYDCVAAYGFTTISNEWSCGLGKTASNDAEEKLYDLTDKEWRLFPNPSVGQVNVEFPEEVAPTSIRLYDLQGKQIVERRINGRENNIQLDLSSLNNGTYMVILQYEDRIDSKKIVLMK